MNLRTGWIGCVLTIGLLASGGAQGTTSGDVPSGHWAPIAQAPPSPNAPLAMAQQMQSQFAQTRRLLTALADAMPAEAYAFKPVPEMRTFAAAVAHVAGSNFGYCANLTGQPSPHKGEDVEKTFTTKSDAVKLLKDSFDFCASFTTSLTDAVLTTTYPAAEQGPDGTKRSIEVERGGLFANLIEHCNEMYGYMSVYARLKGIVPPSSVPPAGRGRGGATEEE